MITFFIIVLAIPTILVALVVIAFRKGHKNRFAIYSAMTGIYLLCVITIVIIFGEDARNEFTFKTGSELLNSSTAKNGWIPEDFPENTSDIEVTINLDNNTVWLMCNFSGKLPERYSSSPEVVDSSILRRLSGRPFGSKIKGIDFKELNNLEYFGVKNGNILFYYKKHTTS